RASGDARLLPSAFSKSPLWDSLPACKPGSESRADGGALPSILHFFAGMMRSLINPQDDSPPRTRLKHLFQPADRRVRVLPVNHKRDDFLSSSQMESAINVFSGFASRAIRDEGLLADRIPALRDRPLEINFTLIASQGRDFLPTGGQLRKGFRRLKLKA